MNFAFVSLNRSLRGDSAPKISRYRQRIMSSIYLAASIASGDNLTPLRRISANFCKSEHALATDNTKLGMASHRNSGCSAKRARVRRIWYASTADVSGAIRFTLCLKTQSEHRRGMVCRGRKSKPDPYLTRLGKPPRSVSCWVTWGGSMTSISASSSQ